MRVFIVPKSPRSLTRGWRPGFPNPPLRCCSEFLSARFKIGSKVAANHPVRQEPSFALRNFIPKFCKNTLRKEFSPTLL